MKYWKQNPLAFQWQWLSNDDKRKILKSMRKDDIEAIKRLKKTFNAMVLELELHESVD